jgi:hypothetical protein
MSVSPCNNHTLHESHRLAVYAIGVTVITQKQSVESSGVNGHILKHHMLFENIVTAINVAEIPWSKTISRIVFLSYPFHF